MNARTHSDGSGLTLELSADEVADLADALAVGTDEPLEPHHLTALIRLSHELQSSLIWARKLKALQERLRPDGRY